MLCHTDLTHNLRCINKQKRFSMREELDCEPSPNAKLLETLCNLELVEYQLADLLSIKSRLVESIKIMVGHEKEGSKTYRVEHYDVEVTTPYNYSIDKKAYEKFKHELPSNKNPVRESIKYDVDKAKYREVMSEGNADMALCLSEFIGVKVGKCSVNVKARKE